MNIRSFTLTNHGRGSEGAELKSCDDFLGKVVEPVNRGSLRRMRHWVRKLGNVILTALEASDRGGDGLEVTPLDEPTDGGLQLHSGGHLADTFHECLGHDDTPPGLNPDCSLPHSLVLLLSHTPPHVLLNDDDQRVKSLGTEGFESGQHSRPEKNLCETILVFVGVVDCPLQDQGTQLLEFKVLDHGEPFRRRDKHVVSWEQSYSLLQETRV